MNEHRMTKEEAKKRLEVWLICGECPEDKQCYDSHLHSTCEYTDYCDKVSLTDAVKVAISALSVPEREKGEWVYSERFSKVFPMYRCSKCSGLSASCYVKFCPNCGADMRGE